MNLINKLLFTICLSLFTTFAYGDTANDILNRLTDKISSIVEASLIGVDVEVSLAKMRSIQVFVLGNSFSPGAYTISSLSNISNILFFSGGPTSNGSLRNIEIKRNGETVGNFDFYDLLINGNTKNDVRLQSNDAIVIKPTGKTISILGEVKKQAIFELLDNGSVLAYSNSLCASAYWLGWI